MSKKVKIAGVEYLVNKNGIYTLLHQSFIGRIKKVINDVRCGWHSGFSLCCIMWYLFPWKLILKYAKWEDGGTFYHKWMDRRPPNTVVNDLILDGELRENGFYVNNWTKVSLKDWGMIPCPFHLIGRKRKTVLTCFCLDWEPEMKELALSSCPELCVKE